MTSHLHHLAEAEIESLEAMGLKLSLSDKIHLNDLARMIENPPGGSTVPAGTPTQAGALWLWPFTIQASVWYAEACTWFDGDIDTETVCLAYAMANARVPGAFDHLQSHSGAKETLKVFRKTMACTTEELTVAVSAIVGQMSDDPGAEDEEDDESGSNWGDLIAQLCVSTGTAPEVWTCSVSQDYLLTQINAVVQQNRSKGDPPSMTDPKIRAEMNFGKAIKEIRQRGTDG